MIVVGRLNQDNYGGIFGEHRDKLEGGFAEFAENWREYETRFRGRKCHVQETIHWQEGEENTNINSL